MLWGIMMAPMMPMACSSSFRPQPGQLGRKMPFSTSTCPGLTTTYWEAVRRGTVSCHAPTTGWWQWGHHVAVSLASLAGKGLFPATPFTS